MTEEQIDPKILTVEYLITREFTSASEFSMHIEREAIRRKIGYLETLMEYCEEKNIDTVAVASMITSSLKAKIQAEAEEMNLLKKSPKLPV
jgi:hypothetical protein